MELWDRCPKVYHSMKKKNKINIKAKPQKKSIFGIDDITEKPINISFPLAGASKIFGIYTTEDVIAHYRNFEQQNRFQFALYAIFVEMHRYIEYMNDRTIVTIPDLRKNIFQLIVHDSVKSDSYPNFIEVFIRSQEGLDGEMIHAPNHSLVTVNFDGTLYPNVPRVHIQFQVSEIIKLMKEYAEYYSQDQINSKIKFWTVNKTHVIQNLKTDLNKFFKDSIQAELDMLEEFRVDNFQQKQNDERSVKQKLYLCNGVDWLGKKDELDETKLFLQDLNITISDIIRWEVKYADKCNAVFLFDQLKSKNKIPKNIKDTTIISKLLFIEESGKEHFLKAPNWSAHRSKMSANPPYYQPDPTFVIFANSL
jgi:hypothetical protein